MVPKMFELLKFVLFFSEVRLTPMSVDGEVNILQQLSGYDEERHVLESIDYWGMYCLFRQ